jgi:hypothetical protein
MLFKVAEKRKSNLEKHLLIFAKKNRNNSIFTANHNKVLDDSDHFPINTVSEAKKAISRSKKYTEVPKWYDGSLSDLINTVVSAVNSKFPDLKDKTK